MASGARTGHGDIGRGCRLARAGHTGSGQQEPRAQDDLLDSLSRINRLVVRDAEGAAGTVAPRCELMRPVKGCLSWRGDDTLASGTDSLGGAAGCKSGEPPPPAAT